jgi:hypothetical protein
MTVITPSCQEITANLFNKEQDLTAINSIKDKKAAGPDKIYKKHLRATAEDLLDICHLKSHFFMYVYSGFQK